jgi:hypothetical protein
MSITEPENCQPSQISSDNDSPIQLAKLDTFKTNISTEPEQLDYN